MTSGRQRRRTSYFDGPVGGSGLTPANNPHGAGWKRIGRDEVVYIDYTCVINGYTADGARMFVIGDVSAELRAAHEAALAIQRELVGASPGYTCEEVYLRAEEMAREMGWPSISWGPDRVRFIGHGVGLELDEYPIFAKGVHTALEPGMTFALEPKFVFPEGAIGTENTFLLTADGVRVLTRAPETITRV